MYTIEEIKSFCEEFGFKPMSTKSELKILPSLIIDGEKLICLIEGTLKKIGNREVNGTGLFFITDKRVVFYRKSILGTETKEEILLNKISSVSYRKGLMFGSIVITSSNNDALIENCDKKQAERVSGMITELLNNMSQVTQQTQQSTSDIGSQIEKLFELKQKGILTEDEFNQQKSKLLNS